MALTTTSIVKTYVLKIVSPAGQFSRREYKTLGEAQDAVDGVESYGGEAEIEVVSRIEYND